MVATKGIKVCVFIIKSIIDINLQAVKKTMVIPQKYRYSQSQLSLYKASLKVRLCHSEPPAKNLRRARSDKGKGEVKTSPHLPWQGALLFTKLC